MIDTTLLLLAIAGTLSLVIGAVAAVFPAEFVARTIGRIRRRGLRRAVASAVGLALAGLIAAIYLLPGLLLRSADGHEALLVLPWVATIPLLTIGMFLATGIARITTVALFVLVASGLGAAVGSAAQLAANEPDTTTPTVAFVIALAALTAFISWANADPRWVEDGAAQPHPSAEPRMDR